MNNQLELFTNFYGRLCEFMVIISPSEEIKAEVEKLKKRLARNIGKFEALFSKAHISLFRFKEYENQIEPVIGSFKNGLKQFSAFNVDLKNYDFFDPSQTIYIDIVNKEPIRNILYTIVNKKIDYTPHLTIAKKLSPEDFLSLKSAFSVENYKNSFVCDRITILSRPDGEKYWKNFVDIPLS